MGDYGVNLFGSNSKFNHNEIFESNYKPDPGCGAAQALENGGARSTPTLLPTRSLPTTALVAGARSGPTTGTPARSSPATTSTGATARRSLARPASTCTSRGNLFVNGGWGKGSGACGNNCNGAVDLNSSGGFKVPGSRYQNEILVSGNQFVNNWLGVDIWQAGAAPGELRRRLAERHRYCSGGFPNSTATAAGGHTTSPTRGTAPTAGLPPWRSRPRGKLDGPGRRERCHRRPDRLRGSQIDQDLRPTGVNTFTGTGTINATTAASPSSGQLRVGTSAAWADGGGSYTGAILSYRGTTPSSFTGVSLVRGSGSLARPIREVQPYKVTAEKCFANDCAVTVSPPLAAPQAAGAAVSNAGTCQLYATSSALPSGPLAPDGFPTGTVASGGQGDISVTGNFFQFDPSVIASSAPLVGGGRPPRARRHTGTPAGPTSWRTRYRGGAVRYADRRERDDEQFVLYRVPVMGLRLHDESAANLNALASPPGAPRIARRRRTMSGRTTFYSGPWGWYAYLFGTCAPLPADPATGKSMPSGACGILDLSAWNANWQQDRPSG